ncbi:hypothetical protein HY745_03670 [Candidatus Desantisbacteria bacterium]|nr:hypothetical protein [Candidatus Desantisbacteria bacterium]
MTAETIIPVRTCYRFLKGAFVEVPPGAKEGQTLNPIYFQFNPETIERTKSGTWTSANSIKKANNMNRELTPSKDKGTKTGFTPSPEMIKITLKLDSAEKSLRSPCGGAEMDMREGILPELAALENLMKKVELSAKAGGSKNSPTLVREKEIPLILFVWGNYRVIPVTILSMSITEQKFNYLLTPIRAEINVSLQVLEEEDSKLNDLAHKAYSFTEEQKKSMKNSFYENQQSVNKGLENPDIAKNYPVILGGK